MRTLLCLLLLSSSIFGQTIVVKNETVIAGLTEVRQFGDYLLASQTDTVRFVPAATVEIVTEASNISVKFTNKEREPVPFIRINDKQYLLTTPGRVWIDAICVDFPKNILAIEQSTVTIGEPDLPGPGPGPTPDIPEDKFDNLGRRVAQWTASLPSRSAIAKVYLENAKALRSNPNSTISEQSTQLAKDLRTIPDYTKYVDFVKNVNEDLTKRWPISKGVLADYWTVIAVGLGATP
jgi:hypothetical protein